MKRLSWAIICSVLLHGLILMWVVETPHNRQRSTKLLTVDLAMDAFPTQNANRSSFKMSEHHALKKSLPPVSKKPVTAGPQRTPTDMRYVTPASTDSKTLHQPSENSQPKATEETQKEALMNQSTSSHTAPTENKNENNLGRTQDNNEGSLEGIGKKNVGANETGPPGLEEHPPVLLKDVLPDYPEEARFKGWEGRVVLDLLVSLDGKVSEVLVAQSSGYSALDKAAIKAAVKWRYRPAVRGGKPVAERLLRTVRFKLL